MENQEFLSSFEPAILLAGAANNSKNRMLAAEILEVASDKAKKQFALYKELMPQYTGLNDITICGILATQVSIKVNGLLDLAPEWGM